MSGTGTKRRLNYTARQRIKRERMSVRLDDSDVGPLLSASLDLDGMNLDPTGRVVIEAYRQTTIERLDIGTVAAREVLQEVPLRLFDYAEGVLCRVKVISPEGSGDPGRLLAVADQMRPSGNEGRDGAARPLLPFRADSSLGQRVWALDLEDDEPFIRMNPRIGSWNDFARSPMFSMLVLPDVLGDICKWVIRNRMGDETEVPVSDWYEFIASLGADLSDCDSEMEADALNLVVDDVVARFSRKHNFADRLAEQLGADEA